MADYHAIIVGAGPAGGQCARELTQAGKRVLLLERAPDFTVNDFSSGGAPLEVMQQFQLPEQVVGSHWKRFFISSSQVEGTWASQDNMGIVFDFRALREFLAGQSDECRLGTPYNFHEVYKDHVVVNFKGGEASCQVLIDATGSDRRVFGPSRATQVMASGVEHLIEVDTPTHRRYADQLSFFLGQAWMPQGYAWIFPMPENRLKVGVARYFVDKRYVPHETSFLVYLDRLLSRNLGSTEHPIIDKHGKTIRYTYGRRDKHADGRVLAVGDAVSTINPIGGEGVRHAMVSGHLAAEHSLRFLDGDKGALESYPAELRRYTRGRWWASELLMYELYRQPNDGRIDSFVQALRKFSYPQLMELIFHYRYREFLRFGLRYGWDCLRSTLRS